MDRRSAVGRQMPVLIGLFVGLGGLGFGMGLLDGVPVPVALGYGLLVGTPGAIALWIVYLALVRGSPRYVRVLQGLFLGFVAVAIVLRASVGTPLASAAVSGFFVGGLLFVPVAVVVSALYLTYSIGLSRGLTGAS